MKYTPTETLTSALRVLSVEIYSEDGVANATLAEAAERMEALARHAAEQYQVNQGLNAHLRRVIDRASALDDQVCRLIRHCAKHGVPVSSTDIVGEIKP